jgi:hypothetical protein
MTVIHWTIQMPVWQACHDFLLWQTALTMARPTLVWGWWLLVLGGVAYWIEIDIHGIWKAGG